MNLPNLSKPVNRNPITDKRAVNTVGNIFPSDDWDCYSGRNCSGKILNHKDPHNCKNSGGKSDYNNRTNTCTSW